MSIRKVWLAVILSDAPYCHTPFYSAASGSIVARGVADILTAA